MAEVHIIGQLLGASDFSSSGHALFCKWSVQSGAAWTLVSGLGEGQTQVDEPTSGESAFWSHPIDAHFATRGIQGWPKILVQVYRQDAFGRNDLVGYGFCHVPASPGQHAIDVVTWKPSGNVRDAVNHFFLGGGHQLRKPEVVVTTSDRNGLTSTAMGKVHLQLGIIVRNFDKFGVEC